METPHAGASPPPPGEELWRQLGWSPTADQLRQFQRLQAELRRWNSQRNLTRLVEGDDFWIAQVGDSLWPFVAPSPRGLGLDLTPGPPEVAAPEAGAAEAPSPLSGPPRLIDVGTGGGFPGLALAIALPQLDLTLVDSVGRKLEAVAAMGASLGLGPRLELRCERIERSGRDPCCRARFDWAVARAVAAAPVVAEYLVPLLRPGGGAVLYRGHWSALEERSLEKALALLGAHLEAVRRWDLPGGRGVRHALLVRAIEPCPAAYPRAVGVPARQPLG